jgi:hypothetical protein
MPQETDIGVRKTLTAVLFSRTFICKEQLCACVRACVCVARKDEAFSPIFVI